MFTFNFDNPHNKECSSSDREVEPAVEVQREYQITPYTFPNTSVKFKNNIEVNVLSRDNLIFSLNKDFDNCIQEAEKSHSDLVPGIYEGGLKIWECTYDLGEYILDYQNSISFENKNILDLGCGAGILGIIAKKCGAQLVDFQDYNRGVLKHLTIPNVEMNFSDVSGVRFWSGDWGGFRQKECYDVILTSETIYNPENYKKLHSLFEFSLKRHGVILLAAKLYYFGVGGSISEFCDLIEKKGVFNFKKVFTCEEGVKRTIIELRFAN